MKISRRSFATGLGAICFYGTRPAAITAAADQPFELRVIAYNILQCTGWPADRALARRAVKAQQMTRRLAQELSLYDPHVVTFSESPGEMVTREIAELLGMQHVRFESGEDWPGTLLSKFEVIESRNVPLADGAREPDLFTRHWGSAKLRLPTGAPLVVHSAHLYPGRDPAIRLREIDAMLASMSRDLQSGSPVLLMGDLNHIPDSTEYARWNEAGWTDTFAKVGQGAGMTYPASEPKIRIDYVWAGGPLASQTSAARPLFAGAFRTNPQDAESFALSDHVPQFAAFTMR